MSEVLIEFHASDQILKPRVLTNRIKEWMHFEELQNVGLLVVGPLKPDKCLVIVTESQVGVNEGASGIKSLFLRRFNSLIRRRASVRCPARAFAVASSSMDPGLPCIIAAVFSKLKDRFFGPVLTNQGEAQEPVGAGFVGLHRVYAAKFLNSLVIAMRLK